MIEETLTEAILKIGNHPDFRKLVEPHIAEPQELKAWMVRRTLVALSVLREEAKKEERK